MEGILYDEISDKINSELEDYCILYYGGLVDVKVEQLENFNKISLDITEIN
jgi:hypothetical protein